MRLLLFGAGKRMRYVMNSIKNTSYTPVGLIDNKKSLRGTEVCGLTVCGPENISEIVYDYIIITSELYFSEIREELITKWNVEENRIKHSTYISLLRMLDFYKCNPEKLRPDMMESIDYITRRGYLTDFNADFYDETDLSSSDVFFDEAEKLFFVIHEGKRLYFSSIYKNVGEVQRYYASLIKEQNECSPHRYLDKQFSVREGDVVLDGGVAEGNFALEVVEQAKHIILVEADKEWIHPLELTFAPYKDKVTIINKFLSDTCDDNNITINKLYESYKINKIKLDIEGGEISALKKASECLAEQDDLELAICAYHNVRDEFDIKLILHQYGYETSTSLGYMTFMSSDCEPKQFVHGLVKGRKAKHNNMLPKVILWGAGRNLSKVISCLRTNNVDVLGVVDSNEDAWGSYVEGEVKVYSPQILRVVGYDYLIITAKYDKGILNSCAEKGIPENKIVSFWKNINVTQDIQDILFDLDKRQNYINEQLIQLYKNRVMNAPYEYGPYEGPEITGSKELLEAIIEHGYSLTRFGDGEYEMLLGNSRPWFQSPNPRMKAMLQEIIDTNESGLQVAHADNWGSLEKYTEDAADGIRAYVCDRRESLIHILKDNQKHGDAYCTRPWLIYQNEEYASEIFGLWKRVWEHRKVVIVEGEFSRVGVGNDLLSTAASVRRIICPHKNAFDIYDTILEAIEGHAQKDELLLVSLGPTATCLVYDLHKKGFQSIDIGQIDSEYEWFLIRSTERVEVPNKLVAEANGAGFDSSIVQSNNDYQKQIIWSFNV